MGKTLAEKIWADHIVRQHEGSLLRESNADQYKLNLARPHVGEQYDQPKSFRLTSFPLLPLNFFQ